MKRLDQIRSWFGWTSSPKPEFECFKMMAGILPPLPVTSPNAVRLNALLAKNGDEVTWEEIQAGRIALLEVMPLEILQAQFGNLSDEYVSVTGGHPFAQGSFATPPTTRAGWCAGVMNLLDELAKFRRARLMFERVRSTVGLCFGGPLLVLLLAAFLYGQKVIHDSAAPEILLWQPLLFAGLIGAGFSVLTRLYSLTWSPRLAAQIEDVQTLKKGLVINCLLSLAEGVIAAEVIYFLFASGLLKGDLFPVFTPPVEPGKSMFMRLTDNDLASVPDVAKLLLWAFIAGFAERLVPDKLNQLAGQADESK